MDSNCLFLQTKILDTEGVKHSLLGLHCTCCQIAFELFEEHRAHYKSEWHRYNLKQKIRNKQTIDEPKFLALESNLIYIYIFSIMFI